MDIDGVTTYVGPAFVGAPSGCSPYEESKCVTEGQEQGDTSRRRNQRKGVLLGACVVIYVLCRKQPGPSVAGRVR